MRLTQAVCQKLLENNEGFRFSTYYSGRNCQEEHIYTISSGQLYIRTIGKTSWADSDYDETRTATHEEVHRFLYKYLDRLNTDGLE